MAQMRAVAPNRTLTTVLAVVTLMEDAIALAVMLIKSSSHRIGRRGLLFGEM
jgi:hypothetical protein